MQMLMQRKIPDLAVHLVVMSLPYLSLVSLEPEQFLGPLFICFVLSWSFMTIDIFKVSGQLFYRKYLILGLFDVSSRGDRGV